MYNRVQVCVCVCVGVGVCAIVYILPLPTAKYVAASVARHRRRYGRRVESKGETYSYGGISDTCAEAISAYAHFLCQRCLALIVVIILFAMTLNSLC